MIKQAFFAGSEHFTGCHAATLAADSGGKVIAAWFAGSHGGHEDVGIWISKQVDSGGWEVPRRVAKVNGNADQERAAGRIGEIDREKAARGRQLRRIGADNFFRQRRQPVKLKLLNAYAREQGWAVIDAWHCHGASGDACFCSEAGSEISGAGGGFF